MHDVAIESRAGSERGRAGESFETLYRRLMPRVYGYVASLLRDQTAAEDVTALAFERAYRRRRSFRPSRGTPESWMFGIARNAALDELRRRRRRADARAGCCLHLPWPGLCRCCWPS
ncbi:MAG: sigma-70 family RNA polymerase sigma factor [Thermoleophilaceae bacterium]|jgi:RNA polymerase sigma-70 factor (ECF subfamily)|nr:sigma-70 family RNA polymerase sigma factor [Thermoleophilaceae bacterium]